MSEQADKLAEPFDPVHQVPIGGGGDADYVTVEQVISRLNQVLGPAGWTFSVREHGLNGEADECWALGQLRATIDGTECTREQFGSQKVRRSKSTGAPLDIGFDLKGAGSDALKKCATLVGVALYLSEKGGQSAQRTAAGGIDWTAFWTAMHARQISAVEVADRLGMPVGSYAQAHPELTTEALLNDPKLA